jgi:ABC-type polysaccharide/polyol phosphate transport system ATPase subunit
MFDMMDKEVIIDIKGLKKQYKLGQINADTLQHRVQSWWAKRKGKTDPNSKVDNDVSNRISGQTIMALDGIDLKIYKGESLGIIGRNGSGKSTLLKILSRITAPTRGSVEITGRVTSMLEVGTGFDGELTGRENIYLNGAILGMTKSEIDTKIEEIIEFSEVRDFIDTPVKRYSSGMYSKLAFSVAAHLDSEIMVMDEVLAVGDVAFQNKCLRTMKDAVDHENKTVLYVSHNMNQIRRLCDRCIVLQDGKIIFQGDTEKAIDIYTEKSMTRKTSRHYGEYTRPAWVVEDRIRIISSEFLNSPNAVYEDGENPVVRLRWMSNDEIKNISLRLELRSLSDSRIGIYLLKDFAKSEKNQIYQTDVEFDISNLVNGTYDMVYTFFIVDKFSNNHNLDCVPGLSFTKTGSSANESLVWEIQNWGYMSLPGAKILANSKA